MMSWTRAWRSLAEQRAEIREIDNAPKYRQAHTLPKKPANKALLSGPKGFDTRGGVLLETCPNRHQNQPIAIKEGSLTPTTSSANSALDSPEIMRGTSQADATP